MIRSIRMAFLCVGLCLVSTAARAQDIPSDYQDVLKSLDRKGDFKAGVLKVNIPRSDLLHRTIGDSPRNPQVKAFVRGVTAAAVGAIAGAAVILSKRALVDMTTAAIAVISLVALLGFKKISEPVLILGAGIAGIMLHRGA